MWDQLAQQTLAGAKRALARAGLKKTELDLLAEDVAQETLLHLLACKDEQEMPNHRTWQRALWRFSARALRLRRKQFLPLTENLLANDPLPPNQVAAREAQDLLLRQLGDQEKELLSLLDQGGRPGTRIHRSALAHELGVSRRTASRRLDLLGQLIRHTARKASLDP